MLGAPNHRPLIIPWLLASLHNKLASEGCPHLQEGCVLHIANMPHASAAEDTHGQTFVGKHEFNLVDFHLVDFVLVAFVCLNKSIPLHRLASACRTWGLFHHRPGNTSVWTSVYTKCCLGWCSHNPNHCWNGAGDCVHPRPSRGFPNITMTTQMHNATEH
jgi:hypothetical protein